jgi:cytochrome oxidase assembly protein ShyY1
MKIRKELWFGFALMALIIAGGAVHAAERAQDRPTATSAC